MSAVLGRAVALLVLIAAVAIPSGAPARDGGVACDSAVGAVGRCDARRPAPVIRLLPAAPRAGTPVVMAATSPGRGVTYAWDLDGDGAFDDGTGASAVTTFAAGTRDVGVLATDEDGRQGSELRTFAVHTANARPSGRLRVVTPSPGAATITEVVVDGVDPDGHVAKIEIDIHGDGEYDVAVEFAPGQPAHAEHRYPDPVVGSHMTAARVTDDAGATAVLTTSLDVHLQNLPPIASIAVSPSAPRPGEPVTVSASATDPDGPVPNLTFDLDGDGTYETDAGGASSVQTTFAAEGLHELGAQAHDVDGDTGVSRRSVEVAATPRAPLEITPPEGPVRPGAVATFHASAEDVTWDMDDDGAFDDGAAHAFPAAGSFPVRARAGDGRVAMRTVTVVANAGLAPAVTALELPAAIRAGRPASFSAAAVDPDGGPVRFGFDLDGDGAFDDEPEAVPGGYRWTFSTAGRVTVAVRATDPENHSAIRTAEIEPAVENLPPDVALEPGALIAGVPTTLHATAADPEGGPVTFAWDTDGDGDFDDGDSFTQEVATQRTLRVRAMDDSGATTTAARTVVVGTRPPVAAFTPSTPTPTVGEEVTLTSPPDPNALPNDTTAPTVFEEGDNTRPTLELLKATPTDKGAKAKVDVSEAGTLTLRLKHGKRIVATKRVAIEAGKSTASIALPKRLQDKRGRYRLQVWATDAVELDSTISAAWIEFRP